MFGLVVLVVVVVVVVVVIVVVLVLVVGTYVGAGRPKTSCTGSCVVRTLVRTSTGKMKLMNVTILITDFHTFLNMSNFYDNSIFSEFYKYILTFLPYLTGC